MSERSHPGDDYSRTTAQTANAKIILNNFENAIAHTDPAWRARALEVIASVAIARVQLLERQLARQEQHARTLLYPRSGRVENVIPISRTPGAPSASREQH